jgi:hypothetical protein
MAPSRGPCAAQPDRVILAAGVNVGVNGVADLGLDCRLPAPDGLPDVGR